MTISTIKVEDKSYQGEGCGKATPRIEVDMQCLGRGGGQAAPRRRNTTSHVSIRRTSLSTLRRMPNLNIHVMDSSTL